MLNAIYSKLTAPTTRYERGNATAPMQKAAAAEVDSLERTAHQLGDGMREHTGAFPAIVNGSVTLGSQTFKGRCSFDAQGQVTDLNMAQSFLGSADRIEVVAQGNASTIHATHMFEGSPSIFDMSNDNTLEQHQWAISNGPSVKYKEYSFFSAADPTAQ